MARIVGMITIRVAQAILVLFLVSVIIFAAVQLLPGDLASEILGQTATPETLAAATILQGDLGQSLSTSKTLQA